MARASRHSGARLPNPPRARVPTSRHFHPPQARHLNRRGRADQGPRDITLYDFVPKAPRNYAIYCCHS
eukprot:6336927-Prymnesium_polylepis.1